MINQKELVKGIVEKLAEDEVKVTQATAKAVLDAAREVAVENVKEDDVKLFDGLTLCAVYKEAHTGRNPLTGESIEIDAKYAPKAKFGKSFKEDIQ